MRVPDFLVIPALISSELWRRFSRRVRSGPLYRWRYSGTQALGLTMAPKDLRPADEEFAKEIYSGRFTFAHETVATKGNSPFSITPPSPEWFTELHSFRWLRHLRAADSELLQANASAFITDWINQFDHQLDDEAWRSDITATRLISWFSHAPLMGKNTSPENYRYFLKSLARQTRYLHNNAPNIRDGYPRLLAMVAMCYSSLCLEGREKTIALASQELDTELKRQILPDGGHISRNPIVLLELLADILPLREAFIKQGVGPSATLIAAIDRMMAALRFFRHSNGDLAQFNGTGFTPTSLLTTILRYDSSKGQPQKSAPQSGYERLAASNTVVLIDTGKALSRATARRAMAGTLSFELSSGNTRFITNCGIPESNFKNYAPFARETAAHTTAIINNESSSRFANESKLHSLLPSPLIRGPRKIIVSHHHESGFESVKSSHDGYLHNHGLIHTRELHLADDGGTLNGIDRFTGANGVPLSSASPALKAAIVLRFHLPPTISASPLSSGHSILIATSDNDAWTFSCVDGAISLEESIQFSGPGLPRKSEQIVVTAAPGQTHEIRWVLIRRNKKTSNARNKNTPPETTPDLLDILKFNRKS